MRLKRSNRKLLNLLVILTLTGTLVVANVLFTMISKQHLLSGQNVYEKLYGSDIYRTTTMAQRGKIYDQNGTVLAQDTVAYTIIAYLDEERTINQEPAYVADLEDTARQIAEVLGDAVDADTLVEIMQTAKENQKDQTELGAGTKRISKTKMQQIKKLELPGIDFIETSDRDYPTGIFASHLLGFASYDEEEQRIVGKMGLEQTLEKYLSGTDGMMQYQRAADGTELPGTRYVEKQAVNGNDVYLTLDANVQAVLEESLKTTMKKDKADSAWALVMEVETGRILGWGSYPSFDKNKHDITQYLNYPSDVAYEPGSVMKGITYAAAIDSGNYPYDETFRAKTFHYTFDESSKTFTRTEKATGYPSISDALGRDFGTISFDEGFYRSSNVGICCLIAQYLPYQTLEEYLDRFGFFQSVDIPFIANAKGVKNFTRPSDILSTGFGQASSVSALQMVQAYSAILNDGVMVRPYVVEKIVDSYSHETLESWTAKQVGTPISAETSEYMRKLMEGVVSKDYGSGARFRLDDVKVLAKTGTGQIAGENGYDDSTYTNSVMLAAPADDPKIMVYYAFTSSNLLYYDSDVILNLFQEALIAANITGSGKSEEADDDKKAKKWESYETPAFINHTLDYVKQHTADMKSECVIIGNGSEIIAQYPAAGSTITSNDRLLLLSDASGITMPDMKGWTRKDVLAFWELTGIAVEMSGSGKVTSQSVAKGKTISADSEIKVELE